MGANEQHGAPKTASPSGVESRAAGQVINVFILAWKNYGLYPEEHESTIKSIENLLAAFNKFLAQHGDLRLTVEKDRLLYQSEIIHEAPQGAASEDIINLLYRDGIKWIEFQEGLSFEEIAAFFRIAHKYRMFTEEAEGDIVTALMDEELECIDFKAVDIFWQDLLLMNFSRLPPPAPQPEDSNDRKKPEQTQPSSEKQGEETASRSIADPSIEDVHLELSDADRKALRQMVKEEENWDITGDLFDLLLIILNSQNEQEKFSAVLEFIAEVVVETIEMEKYDLLVTFFQALYALASRGSAAEQDWKNGCIDRFFKDLSRPDIFRRIGKNLLNLQTTETGTAEPFEAVLHYFYPTLVPFLVPAVTQNRQRGIQQLAADVIVHLSRRDIGPLEKVAAKHGHEMGERLLDILKQLDGKRTNTMLFNMCSYPEDTLRRKAIKEIIERDPKYTQTFFSLIDDPSNEVRAFILSAFGKRKSSALENMLLNYLQENLADKDASHIHACFRALGLCGSNAAVPFLKRLLLFRGWNRMFGSGKAHFREGAAIALKLLGTQDARQVLDEASKSRFKVIRNAVDRTMGIRPRSGETPDD